MSDNCGMPPKANAVVNEEVRVGTSDALIGCACRLLRRFANCLPRAELVVAKPGTRLEHVYFSYRAVYWTEHCITNAVFYN